MSLHGLKARVFLGLNNIPLSRRIHTFFPYKMRIISSPLSTSWVFCEIKEVNNTRALCNFRQNGVLRPVGLPRVCILGPSLARISHYREQSSLPGHRYVLCLTSVTRVCKDTLLYKDAVSNISTVHAHGACTPTALAVTSRRRGPDLRPQRPSRGQR